MNDDRMHDAVVSLARRFLGRLGGAAVAVGAGARSGRGGERRAQALSASSTRAGPSTRLRADLRAPAAVRRRKATRPRGRARRARLARRPARRAATSSRRGPVQLITDPSLSVAQPRQPDAHRRHDVHRPVHGPRHDLRPRVAARQADAPSAIAQRPHAVASTSTRSTAPARSRARALRPRRPGEAEGRVRRPVRGPAADARRHGDRSPTRATTRT